MSTIEDVAKYAGFSTATVSRVLNNKGPVSEKAVLAVQEAIDFLVAEAKLTDAVKEEASEK